MSAVRSEPAATLQLQPWDEHNRTLVSRVHPEGWVNPEPRGRYQLVVIGAGTGGLVSAAIAATLGARVALVERHLMGGDCLNVGCVPSKALIRAARAWHAAAQAAPRFGGPRVREGGDFAGVMTRMRRIRAEISLADSAERFRAMGVDVFFGEARFTSDNSLEVDGTRLRFRRAIVASGTRPGVPPINGLREAGYVTNETVFGLTELPPRLVVLGAGAVGTELAQSFARFGSIVTLLEQAERVLPDEDADAALIVQRSLERDGVRFVGGAEVQAVERRGGERVVHYTCGAETQRVVADQLLIAVGRSPNVERLGLEAAGIASSARGIETDERLRTSNRRVFAVGDVASAYRFTHAADAQARLAIRNALFWGRGRVSSLVVPWCTYTDPELAHVGLAGDAARQDDGIESITVPFEELDRPRIDASSEGFLRLHLKGDGIAGATLVGEHAGELIGQVVQAMVARTALSKLGETIFPYPTHAEVFRRAADHVRRRKLTPPARRAFELFFRVVR